MKKGQLQIQETIIVTFICVVLILIGLGFFYKYSTQKVIQEYEVYQQEKFDSIIITLPANTLLSCEQLTQKENCLDKAKLMALKMIDKEKKKEFGETKISITQIYPTVPQKECTPQNPQECSTITVYENKPRKITSTRIIETPISLYDPQTQMYSIAKLIIEGYNL